MRSALRVLRPRGSYQGIRLLAVAAAAAWVATGQPILVPFAVATIGIVLLTTATVLWQEHRRDHPYDLSEVPAWLIAGDLIAISLWTLGTAANPESTAFVLFGAIAAETTFRLGTRGALVAFGVFVVVRVGQDILRTIVLGAPSSQVRFSSELIVTATLIGMLAAIVESYSGAQRRASTLERAALSFATSKDLSELASRLATGVLTVVDADYAFLLQRGAPLFRIVAVAGRAPALPGDVRGGVVQEVLRERRTVQIEDYASWPQALPSMRAAGARVVMGTPIVLEGEVGACFVVGRYTPRPFDARDREMLEAFAGHAALAFRDAHVLAKTRQLESLSRDLALEGDEHVMLQRVSDAAAQLLEVESSVIAWIEPGREEGPSAATGVGQRLPFSRGDVAGARAWVQRNGRRLVLDDYQTWQEGTPQARALGLHATVAEPIVVDGHVVAALIVSTTQEERRFTASEVELIGALSAHASVAIRSGRMRRERERRAEHLARLNVVARELSSARDPRALYEKLYRATCDLVPTEAFYVSLYDADRRQHTFVLQMDAGREWDRDAVYPLADGPTSRVVRTGAPYVSLHAEVNAVRFGDEKRPSLSSIHVPMRVGERVIGVLSAQRYVEDGYTPDDVALLQALASHAAAAIENAQLLTRTHELYMASVRALAAAVDARDPYTRSHSARTSALARAIAEEMRLPHEDVRRVQLGALLHDIGKIGIPDAVLNKPGTFTHQERLVMMTHAALGGAILQAVEPLRELAPIVRHHHERFDGAGYPDGIGAEDVPFASYVVAAADAFEVIVSKRAYKEAQTIDFAIEELRRHSGGQFHPAVVDAFVRIIERDLAAGAGYLQRLGQAGHEELESQIAGPATIVEEIAASSHAHTRQLSILQRLASEITAVLDIETLADRLLRIVSDSMAYENGFLLTLSEDGEELEVRAAVGPSRAYLGHRLPRGKGISWAVLESGKALNAPKVRDDPRYFGPPEVRSSLVVPLVLGTERVGVLGVESTRPGAFGDEDEQLLVTVSHQLAAAIRVARLHQEAKTAAATDALTGLSNRRVFFERLEAEVLRARETGGTLCVAMVDVNGLKSTNDTYGHRTGDAALQRIASILTAGVRGEDLVARLGGDEFAVLFPGVTQLTAERVMRRLAERVASDRDALVEGGLPSIAWGISPLPEGSVSADAVVDAADHAMYRHKTLARQRLTV